MNLALNIITRVGAGLVMIYLVWAVIKLLKQK